MATRFELSEYQSVLRRFAVGSPSGVSWGDRMALLPFMQKEPVLWGWKPRLFVGATVGLIGLWLMITLFGFIFHALWPKIVPFVIGTFAAIPGLALVRTIHGWLRRTVELRTRKSINFSYFLTEVSATNPLRPEIARATREALGRSYGLQPERIHADDTERSLRPYYGSSMVFAFEIALGVPFLLGKDYLIGDSGVDDVIVRLRDEPRTVADIVRIMNEAYGGQLANIECVGDRL